MKATKKIVGAACALVAAVALSAGSTFAWFASNDTVSANGLNIHVDTSSSYLIIGNSDTTTASAIRGRAGTLTEVDFKNSTLTTLKPVAHEAISSTTVESYGDSGVWYYQTGANSNASTAVTPEVKTKISSSDNYILKDTVYLTVKAGSGDSDPLHVSTVKVEAAANTATTPTVSPVSVILVCGTNVVEYKNQTGTTWTVVGDGASTLLADKVTDVPTASAEGANSATKVDVYVYYDGANTQVYTDNALNLVDATVSVTFTTIPAPTAG